MRELISEELRHIAGGKMVGDAMQSSTHILERGRALAELMREQVQKPSTAQSGGDDPPWHPTDLVDPFPSSPPNDPCGGEHHICRPVL